MEKRRKRGLSSRQYARRVAGNTILASSLLVPTISNAVTFDWDPVPNESSYWVGVNLYAKQAGVGEPEKYHIADPKIHTKTIPNDYFVEGVPHFFWVKAEYMDGNVKKETERSNIVTWAYLASILDTNNPVRNRINDPEDVQPPQIIVGPNVLSLYNFDPSLKDVPVGNINNPIICDGPYLDLRLNSVDENYTAFVSVTGESVRINSNRLEDQDLDPEKGEFRARVNITAPGLISAFVGAGDLVGNNGTNQIYFFNLSGITNLSALSHLADDTPPSLELTNRPPSLSGLDKRISAEPGTIDNPFYCFGEVNFGGNVFDRHFVGDVRLEGEGVTCTTRAFNAKGGPCQVGASISKPGMVKMAQIARDLGGASGTNYVYVMNFNGLETWNGIPDFEPPKINVKADQMSLGNYNPALTNSPAGSEANPFVSVWSLDMGGQHVSGTVTDDGVIKSFNIPGAQFVNFDRANGNFYANLPLPTPGTNTFQAIAEDFDGKRTTNTISLVRLQGLKSNLEGLIDNTKPTIGCRPMEHFMYPGGGQAGTEERPYLCRSGNMTLEVWAQDNFAIKEIRVIKDYRIIQTLQRYERHHELYANIPVDEGQVHEIRLVAEDYSGNLAESKFFVKDSKIVGKDGMSAQQKIERGRDPYRDYVEYVVLNGDPTNGLPRLTFSANDESEYAVYHSKGFGDWARLTNQISYATATNPSYNNQREGTVTDTQPDPERRFYRILSERNEVPIFEAELARIKNASTNSVPAN